MVDYTKSTKRYETMLLLYDRTTNSFDYLNITDDLKREGRRKWEEKLHCHRTTPAVKQSSALSHWREPMVTFNLYTKPKDIVQTDPRDVQRPCFEVPDELREQVQKTRPRVLLSPAMALDEITHEPRRKFIEDFYTTSTLRALNLTKDLSTRSVLHVRAPVPAFTTKTNPITLKRHLPPYVSPEWHRDTFMWEDGQVRDYVDATQAFWLDRDKKRSKLTPLKLNLL